MITSILHDSLSITPLVQTLLYASSFVTVVPNDLVRDGLGPSQQCLQENSKLNSGLVLNTELASHCKYLTLGTSGLEPPSYLWSYNTQSADDTYFLHSVFKRELARFLPRFIDW